MYVCACKAVTEEQVRRAVDDGARDLATLVRACGAGVTCGSCVPLVGEILAHQRPVDRDVDSPSRRLINAHV